MPAPLRPLAFLLTIASAVVVLILVHASPSPDMTRPATPRQVSAAALPAAGGAPSSSVVPAPPLAALGTADGASGLPAPPLLAVEDRALAESGDAPSVADATGVAPAGERTPDPPFAPLADTIEGVDAFELFLQISGTIVTTPWEPPVAAVTEPQPTVATEPQPPAATTVVSAPLSPAPAPVALTGPIPERSALPTVGSVFDQAQVVSFYGYPGVGVMGELGLHSPADAAAAIARVAAEYDELNGEREVIPALHLIVGVAQRHPGNDGLYLLRMDDAQLNAYVEAAREANILLFIDTQIGWSDALTEVMLLEDALREPFVHLALDPEFATRSAGTAPGVSIGTLGADDVNAVQQYLAGLVREHDLPPKVLVLHQFLTSMLTGVEWYDDVPEVEVTVDMDGFGSPHVKLLKYEIYATSAYSERAAIKLFYHWDAPLLTPAQLISLEHPPDLVIYQ